MVEENILFKKSNKINDSINLKNGSFLEYFETNDMFTDLIQSLCLDYWIDFKKLDFLDKKDFLNKSIFVDNIFIPDEYRELGYGRCLINQIITTAKETNKDLFLVAKELENQNIIKFYQKFGFYIVKKIDSNKTLMKYNLFDFAQ